MPCNCTTGTGSPEGVVTGAVGDQFVQSNGLNGRTLWRKRFATAGNPPSATQGWALMQGSLDVLNVKDYGAVGDGSNDTTKIQSALSAAQPGDTVYFPRPSTYYGVDAALPVPPGVTVLGEGAEIRQITSNAILFSLAGDNITVEGLTLVGPQFAELQSGGKAISCEGASAASYRSNIRILRCRFASWGLGAVWLKYVEDFALLDNIIQDCYYDGILGASVRRGAIHGNRITNIIGSPAAYGIALTRDNSDSLTDEPRSSDVTVVGNVVDGVPNWEGIDTHGGERITIQANTLRDCRIGIAVVPASKADDEETFAPLEVAVVGNAIDSAVTNGSRSYGIVFTGAPGTTGAPIDLASGVIVGNTIRGYGDEDVDTVGAITLYVTRGVAISGNVVIEGSPHGIIFYYDNYGFTCEGNVFVDPWSNAITTSGPMRVRSQYNFGYIGGNTFVRGAKSATYIFATGIRFDTATNVGIALGLHDFTLTTTPIAGPSVGAIRSVRGAGTLLFPTNNAYDIGDSAATGQPRDVFIGRLLRLDGPAPAIRVQNTVANGTVATTLGNTGPAGSTAGAPRGWLPVSINGTTRYIPFW